MFEVITEKRSRWKWVWRVCDHDGRVVMQGWEHNPKEARYRGDRALFELLLKLGSLDPDPPET